MSNNLANRPLTLHDGVIVVGMLATLTAIPLFFWWRGEGPFKKSASAYPYLENEKTICYAYEPGTGTIAPYSARINEELVRFKASNRSLILKGDILALQENSALPLWKDHFVATAPEDAPSTVQIAALDTAIESAIQKAIQKRGFAARRIAAQEKVSWRDIHPVKPVRLLVKVSKRFEQGKCLFFVDTRLQHDAILSAPSRRHIYADIATSQSFLRTVATGQATETIHDAVLAEVEQTIQISQGSQGASSPQAP